MKKLFLLLFLTLAFNGIAGADQDGAFLDPRYTHLKPAKKMSSLFFNRFPSKSDLESVLKHQTSVKSQGSRGTCSIFSALAVYESTLIRYLGAPQDIDLSEQWLEYIIQRSQHFEGSTSSRNFSTLLNYSAPAEESLPYIGETWTERQAVDENSLVFRRCGGLEDFDLNACLRGHYKVDMLTASDENLLDPENPLYDPVFANARAEAATNKLNFDQAMTKSGSVWIDKISTVKELLNQGEAVTMDIDVYYGAWNHRKAAEKGMTRNMDHWHQGIIGNPEPGSVDVSAFYSDPAGHSVVIVGYDDDVVVETEVDMQDGTRQKFTYKGVYYFKNSWGQGSFGRNTVIDGKPAPGYGMITQTYAENRGSFYRFPVSAK